MTPTQIVDCTIIVPIALFSLRRLLLRRRIKQHAPSQVADRLGYSACNMNGGLAEWNFAQLTECHTMPIVWSIEYGG
ncbi:MAG: hypothetical protein KAJ12_05285 [Bacteroidetes bacterium]|nr:hypothetical protein [Bacteroidota bacterium]